MELEAKYRRFSVRGDGCPGIAIMSPCNLGSKAGVHLRDYVLRLRFAEDRATVRSRSLEE